ncbi:MAG: ATP synthase F1 subunit gamma [Thermoanaerobaculia bacterium]
MPSTIDIRRRIRSVRNTQQITKAMKMVAAAKLRRAQERIVSARPYAGALQEVLRSVASRVRADHPLLHVRDERRVLVLVVTADKGLCGAFNGNVIRAAQNALVTEEWDEAALLPIGRKANDYFRRRDWPIRYQAVNIMQAMTPEVARDLARVIIGDYQDEKIDAVYVVYNEFKSVIQQIVRMERLLPLMRDTAEASVEMDYLYEPSPEEILRQLLPKFVEFQIYRALLESAAAEQAARMTAMEAATRNATDVIDSLTLTYNRIRQASITKEIIEIVSGAAALG